MTCKHVDESSGRSMRPQACQQHRSCICSGPAISPPPLAVGITLPNGDLSRGAPPPASRPRLSPAYRALRDACIVFIASNGKEELARGKGPNRVELNLILNNPSHRPPPRHAQLPAMDQEAGTQEAERERRPNPREGGRDHERKPVDQEAGREAQSTRASHRAAVRTTYRTLTLVPFLRAARGGAPSLEPK